MSEIELVLDSMRKTGECVSELEDALGQRQKKAHPIPAPRQRSAKSQRLRHRWGPLSWFNTIHRQKETEYTYSQVIGRLREKEAFLSEVTKQLRELEVSVDELSREIRRHG